MVKNEKDHEALPDDTFAKEETEKSKIVETKNTKETVKKIKPASGTAKVW